jgi:RES domain-containing protein
VTLRHARDPDLLDALDAHEGVAFEGDVWRIVREGRDVLLGYPSKARWDPSGFDVIYTALAREGALAEVYFHLSRQPVFPLQIKSILSRISVSTRRTLKLADLAAVEALGVAAGHYAGLDYDRSQEIGGAANFLGFDGLIVPSARWPGQNLVLFTNRFDPDDLVVVEQESVDWTQWKRMRKGG